MSQLKQYLDSLNLTEDFLVTCTYTQAKSQIEKAYATSDKSHQKTIAYQKISQILKRLFYQEPTEPIHIPCTYFSFSYQQDIVIEYERLINNAYSPSAKSIPELEHNKNHLFLNIGKSLQNQTQQRKDLFKQAINDFEQQSFKQWMIFQYRCMMIRLFAKENLSDHAYQKALLTGEFWPILEAYKFLWPLKWIAALINSMLLPLQYLKDIPRRYVKFFIDRLKYYEKQPHLSFKDSFFKTLCLFIIVLSYTASYYFIMTNDIPYIFYLAPLIVCSDILEILANPITQFLNPISKKLNMSPITLGLFTGIGVALLFFNLPLLKALEILGIIYLAVANMQNLKRLSQLDLKFTYLLAVLLPYCALYFCFKTLNHDFIIPNMATLWNFSEFTYQLMSQTFNEHHTPYLNQLKCMLPLKEHIEPPQAIQVSINLNCQSKRLSHLFFNTQTPQEAFLDDRCYQIDLRPVFKNEGSQLREVLAADY